MAHEPAPVAGETVDWSFVVDDGCTQCAYSPHPDEETSVRLRAAVRRWQVVLARPDVRDRPDPAVWSPLEYACHVSDMLRLLNERVDQMMAVNTPHFANWDQDQVAVERRYFWADPNATEANMVHQSHAVLLALSRVKGELWTRSGQRSDGVEFTISSLCRFVVHDVEHHLHDVDG